MVSNKVTAILVVIIIILAGFSVYFAVTSSGAITSTTTVTTGSSTVTVTSTLTQSTSSVSQDVVSGCQAEGGQVTVYGVLDSTDWPTLNNILLQGFPFMHVNYVGLSSGDVSTRAKTEFLAGHVTSDIVLDSYESEYPLISVGAIQAYPSPMEKFNNFTGTDPSNYIHPVYGLPDVIEFNTNLVKDNSTLPKTWYDLANPQWKGELAIDDPSTLNTAGPVFAALGQTTTNQSLVTWLNQLKANNPIITSGSGAVYTDVSTGQVSIGVGLLNDVIVGKGAPVGFIYPAGPIIMGENTAALTKGAPHPYCGELMIQWLQSYAGQVAISLTTRIPIWGLVGATYFKGYIPSGRPIITDGSPSMDGSPDQWVTFFQGIFGT